MKLSVKLKIKTTNFSVVISWWAAWESNPQPTD